MHLWTAAIIVCLLALVALLIGQLLWLDRSISDMERLTAQLHAEINNASTLCAPDSIAHELAPSVKRAVQEVFKAPESDFIQK